VIYEETEMNSDWTEIQSKWANFAEFNFANEQFCPLTLSPILTLISHTF